MCLYCHNFASDAGEHGKCTCLEMQWLWVEILAAKALRERQCALEGEARYINAWHGVPREGVCSGDANFFITIDQSETTKSH